MSVEINTPAAFQIEIKVQPPRPIEVKRVGVQGVPGIVTPELQALADAAAGAAISASRSATTATNQATFASASATAAAGSASDAAASVANSMDKPTYDPNAVGADAFDMASMIEATDAKIMTAAERTKLSGIAAGAEVNVNPDWDATSGDAEIQNKPTLGTSAARDVGTTAGTVAAGDDARFSNNTAFVTDRTALAALNTTARKSAVITGEGGRNGLFTWTASDLSALVTADTEQGLYVAPSSDTTGASGAWVRQGTWAANGLEPAWFGAVPNDDTSAATNNTAFAACAAMVDALGGGVFDLGGARWFLSAQFAVSTAFRFVLSGKGARSAQVVFTGTVSGGIKITNTVVSAPNLAADRFVGVSGFAVMADAVVPNTGLEINIQGGWDPDQQAVFLDGVTIDSYNEIGDNKRFSRGIHIIGYPVGFIATNWIVRGYGGHMDFGMLIQVSNVLIGGTVDLPVFGGYLNNFTSGGASTGLSITGHLEALVLGETFQCTGQNVGIDIDGSDSPLIGAGTRNPVLHILGGHANGNYLPILVKAYNQVVIQNIDAYHGQDADIIAGGCIWLEGIDDLRIVAIGCANAPQTAGSEIAIRLNNVSTASIDSGTIRAYADGIPDGSNYTGVAIIGGSKDITFGPGFRIKKSDGSTKKLDWGILLQTGNGAGVYDDVRVMGSQFRDCVFPITTVNAKRCEFVNVRETDCDNAIANAGTPANITETGTIVY